MRKKKTGSAASNRRATRPRGPSPSGPRSVAAKPPPRSRATRERTTGRPSPRTDSPENASALHEQAALLQLTHDAIVVTDLHGVITFWNRGAEEQYGWTATEALGHVMHVLLKTQFPQPFDEILQGLLCDGRWEGELVHSRRDGTPIIVASRWALLCNAQGKPVAILETMNDIAERKRAEDKLRQSMVELERRVAERTANYESANEELEVTNEELRVANEDLGRQVVERRQAEQALQEAVRALQQSEGRYRSLFENMLDGFAYCQMLFDEHDRPVDFVYLHVNAAFETLTGLKDVVGRKVTEVIPGIRQDHPELFEIYGRVAVTGRPERFELEFKPLSIWLSLSVYSPEPGYFVAVFENITERKRNEMEREQLHRESERHAHELEVTNQELEAFTYTVSHDLRGPLNQIDQLARLLLDELGQQLDEHGQHVLRLIHQNATAMNGLAQDLLTLARMNQQPLTRQSVAVDDLVRQVLGELRPAGASAVDQRPVEIEVGELPPAQADPLLLKQVWVNLISNALKFTRTRDVARIEVGCEQWSSRESSPLSSRESTVYYVRDNGVGFDMAQAERLFRAFQRLHHFEDFEGSGLGLAIVERVIRRHGGRVWAQAQVDQGATFYFTLG